MLLLLLFITVNDDDDCEGEDGLDIKQVCGFLRRPVPELLKYPFSGSDNEGRIEKNESLNVKDSKKRSSIIKTI